MGEFTTVDIDLAKNVFSVHGVDAHGKTVLRKTVSRGKLIKLMAQLPQCLVGMEACSGAHQLAPNPQPLGHQPRILMPKFIIPSRRNQKNNGNDAEAINEAVGRSAATLVVALDKRGAAWPNSELGSRVRLVWRLASASTTPQGRLHRCSPLLADESTSAQSTMTLRICAEALMLRRALLPGLA
jgi:transposase